MAASCLLLSRFTDMRAIRVEHAPLAASPFGHWSGWPAAAARGRRGGLWGSLRSLKEPPLLRNDPVLHPPHIVSSSTSQVRNAQGGTEEGEGDRCVRQPWSRMLRRFVWGSAVDASGREAKTDMPAGLPEILQRRRKEMRIRKRRFITPDCSLVSLLVSMCSIDSMVPIQFQVLLHAWDLEDQRQFLYCKVQLLMTWARF